MTTSRITVNTFNKSFTVGVDSPMGMGATVIPASRGAMTPIKINKGETERIKALFGANRYEVLEAIAYNNKYPLWISAPHSGGAFASLLITDQGLKNCPISFDGNPNSIDFSNLCLQFQAGISDGVTPSWAVSLAKELFPDFDSFTPKASLLIGDTAYSISLSWDSAQNQFNINVDSRGVGTLKIADSAIIIDFAFSGKIPDKGTPIAFRFTIDANKLNSPVYGIIGMKFPCDDFLAASLYKSEIENRLIFDLRHIKKGIYYQQSGYPIEISLIKETLNGSGTLIYAPELLKTDDFIFIQPNPQITMDWNTWQGSTSQLVDFKGGFRGVNCTGQTLVEGWEQFKEFKKYPADIYFDTTADPAIPEKFDKLRSIIRYRRFLYPYPMQLRSSEITKKPSVDNRGICAFWGAAYIMNNYEPTGNLLSTLMGEVAAKYADARVFSYGGRAVAWGDENNVGGQLNQGRIVKFLYDVEDDEQRLDKLRINPIVHNELFGPMIASRRTTYSSETDYSYSDYSMIMDYCLERISTEVLPYQIVKFNDDSHRTIVAGKAEAILNPLLVPPNNVIRDFIVKCDSENNGDKVLQSELFVLTVAIKVTPKSSFIVFNFINSAQGGSVEEDVK